MRPLTPEPQGAGLGAPPFLGARFPEQHLTCGRTARSGIRVWGAAQFEPDRTSRTSVDFGVKWHGVSADTDAMMISEQQALAAATHLRSGECACDRRDFRDVPADLLAAAANAARLTPDIDASRVLNAVAFLSTGPMDSREIASMMLKRMVSDSLR